MKNNTTKAILNVNFLAEGIKEELKNEFMVAVEYEKADMSIQLLKDDIARLDVKIANTKGNYTEEEVASFIVKKDTLSVSLADFQLKTSELSEVYEKVVNAMTIKNENGFGNHKDVVRTVLRVLASWDNSKLVKYAIIPCFKDEKLYNALETIHVNSKANDNGALSMTKEVKDAYSNASFQLENIIKTTFSLPFETVYTSKTRVKLNGDDKKLLNECYVKGFKNNYSVDEESGIVSFKKRTVNTLVKSKTNKKTQETTYDYSGLASTIANIVIKYYFA
jgi:hypothetical protein